MKVSPVQGMPTIAQPSATGLSPEKIQRLKTIASGGKVDGAETKETPQTEEEATPLQSKVAQNNSIKMSVNRTPEQAMAQALIDTQGGTEVGNGQEKGVSDTDVETKSEPEAIQPISPQLAALARQKREIQVMNLKLAEERKALETLKSQASFKDKVKNGPLLSSLQEELGISQQELYQRMTDEILGNGQVIDQSKLEERILKQVEDKLAGKDSSQEQAVFEHMKRNVDKATFSSNEFRLIRESKSQDDVMDLIKRSWFGDKDDPENFPGNVVIEEEEACQMIEAVLREDARRYAKIISEMEKPTPSPEQLVPEGQAKAKVSQQIKTLTNKDSARPATSRRQRAIAAALGQK